MRVSAASVRVSRVTFTGPLCTELGEVHIKQRLFKDPSMVECWPISVNILRGGIKKMAVKVDPRPYQLSTLTGDRTKDRVEGLAKDLGYIFPVDPNRMKTELPFQNPAIIFVLKQGVLTLQFKTNLAHILCPPTNLCFAWSMLRLVSIYYRMTGERQSINFTGGEYENMYRNTANHIKTFADGRAAAPLALHKVLHGLYKEISDFKSVQASAGSYSQGRSFLRVFSRLIAAVMTPPVPDVMTAALRVLFYSHATPSIGLGKATKEVRKIISKNSKDTQKTRVTDPMDGQIDAHRVTAVSHNIKQVLSSAPTRIASSTALVCNLPIHQNAARLRCPLDMPSAE
ncbi:hypothetical protein C8J57DRAFT_1241347 [Mycena rebaudengoi]|nr:hypothetical protein C8J57DRAFT_1241347 [Mycena rebaudengoi]